MLDVGIDLHKRFSQVAILDEWESCDSGGWGRRGRCQGTMPSRIQVPST